MLMFVCTGTGEELGDPQEVCRDVVGGGGETRTGVTGPGQGRSADFWELNEVQSPYVVGLNKRNDFCEN